MKAFGVVAAVLLAAGVATAAAPVPSRGSETRISDDKQAFETLGWEREQAVRRRMAVRPEERLEEYARAAACYVVVREWVMGDADGTCPSGDLLRPVIQCEEGDEVLMPLWARERETPSSEWGRWSIVDVGGCGVDLLPPLTAEAFQRLPLPAPALTMQPDRGWVLINVETIVWTDPTPVTLRTELLGHGITVEATPTRWTYDFGDGHDLTTTSPGTPYPHHDVFHIYEKAHDQATITLTAEWTGRYRVDGNPVWRDVNGTAATTATTTPFEVHERRARLVSGLCTDRPKPPDC